LLLSLSGSWNNNSYMVFPVRSNYLPYYTNIIWCMFTVNHNHVHLSTATHKLTSELFNVGWYNNPV